MNEVERTLRISPIGLGIVNLKPQVRRYPARLDGAQVCAYPASSLAKNDHHPKMNLHLRRRVLVCESYGPDPSSRPDVEDALGVSDRCQVQFTVQDETVEMVHQIEPVLFHLVIRQRVLSISKRMITSPVLVLIVQNTRC